jgi:CheY-like chemotaxis protein
LSDKPRILYVGQPDEHHKKMLAELASHYDIVGVANPLQALAHMANERFACIQVYPDETSDALEIVRLVQKETILDGMPDGVVMLNADNSIVWANEQLRKWVNRDDVEGINFYTAFDQPEILGPDFCPFNTASTTGEATISTLKAANDRYFQVHAAPLKEAGEIPYLIVTVRDMTAEVLQQQKLQAIHRAGIELSDLSPEEVFEMAVEDRIELLKSNILHYTKDLLKFDVVEIRLLDQKTGELVTLLSEGIDGAGKGIRLFAKPIDNGVTGFVAATGNSYFCEDTTQDPLYVEGHKGAKSSLTVPLIQHDEVIGTFNVESPRPRGFTESDLQFLEIFSRNVAMAVNTLELLVAQQANTAQASVEAIHGKVAMPVDEILNDAVNVMERYIGHETEVVERLQRILRNARDIKQVIQRVGEEMTPAEAVTETADKNGWPRLRGRRILVVDEDGAVRRAAHSLLEKIGAVVETAHEGKEAILMVRNSEPEAAYDAIIADIRLADMSGFELLVKLNEVMYHVPFILMSGFGYDPGHSIVKARQAGLLPKAILYKPFRRDQLLSTVDAIIEVADGVRQS